MIGMENRKAYMLGYRACEAFVRSGIEQFNPYKKGTEQHKHWKRGFDDCYKGE